MKAVKSLLILWFLSLSFYSKAQDAGSRTEEYAIVTHAQAGKRTTMTVTVGSKHTEIVAEKGESKEYDLSIVIGQIGKLNAMGFELFDTSTTVIPGGQAGGGTYVITFTLKRKIKT